MRDQEKGVFSKIEKKRQLYYINLTIKYKVTNQTLLQDPKHIPRISTTL